MGNQSVPEGNGLRPTGSGGDGRRQYERLPFQKSATFHLDQGGSLRGVTQDVSIRGIFLLTDQRPQGMERGFTGRLVINFSGRDNEFECEVAHVREDGLGLHIQKGAQNFGFALTNAIFGEIGMKLGWEVESSRALVVTVQVPHGKNATKGRVIRLSAVRLSFCAPVTLQQETRDQEADVTLHPPQREPLLLRGPISLSQLWDQQSPCRGGEQLYSLEMKNLEPQHLRTLDEISRSMQQEHFQRTMKDRAKVNTLLSGPEVQRKSRAEVRDDLHRFFGPRN